VELVTLALLHAMIAQDDQLIPAAGQQAEDSGGGSTRLWISPGTRDE
jgi:hypothetical protein